MSEVIGYGYENDEAQINSSANLKFGLNENVFMTGFELVNNAGSGGSEGEALDVTFNINGSEKRDRIFPVSRAFDKNGNPITDRNAPEFKKALSDLNAKVTHIMKAFVDDETLKAALSSPITSFSQYITVLKSILPSNFDKIPLDLFMQYEYQIKGDNDRTWLTFPKKVSYGKFLCRHVEPVGEWKPVVDGNGLHYVDSAGNIHPFKRNKWFMDSPFANQQKEENPLENLKDMSIGAGAASDAASNISGDIKLG